MSDNESNYLTPDDVLPEGWHSEDEDFVTMDGWLCDHTWLEIRNSGGSWWTEIWFTPDKCEGETHNEGFDVFGDTALEVIEAIGPLDALDPKVICRYCSGDWKIPCPDCHQEDEHAYNCQTNWKDTE